MSCAYVYIIKRNLVLYGTDDVLHQIFKKTKMMFEVMSFKKVTFV